MKNLYFVIVMLSLCGCAMSGGFKLANHGSEAIEMCRAEYIKITGAALPLDIDNVYVHAGKTMFALLFTHGDLGTFRERSKDYRARISCYVFLRPTMQVQDLREGPKILKASATMIDDASFYEEKIYELLFSRSGPQFTFEDMQIFSIDRINAL